MVRSLLCLLLVGIFLVTCGCAETPVAAAGTPQSKVCQKTERLPASVPACERAVDACLQSFGVQTYRAGLSDHFSAKVEAHMADGRILWVTLRWVAEGQTDMQVTGTLDQPQFDYIVAALKTAATPKPTTAPTAAP